MTTSTLFSPNAYRISPLDLDRDRRRKLLNIIVTGLAAIVFVTLILISITTVIQIIPLDVPVLLSVVGVLVGCVAVYWINNKASTSVASIIIITMLFLALVGSDTPTNLTQGRSVFFFIIPVILTAVVLPPSYTFISTIVAAALVTLIAILNSISPSFPALAGFFMIALLSWLSSRTLNQALTELRQINMTLEQRVKDRTAELNEALLQVIAESAKNEAILASITDGILVFDKNQNITTVNRALARLIGVSSSDTSGKTIQDLMKGHVADTEQQFVLELFNNTVPAEPVQISWDKKIFAVTYAPFHEVSDTTGSTLLVLRDVTDEAQLQRMKDSLLSMASHELRTPLNAIIGYSDMFVTGALGHLEVEQTSYLRRIMHNGKRMLNLVNNLLDSASNQAGLLRSHATPTYIREVIQDIKDTVEVLAEQQHIALRTEIDPNVPEVVTTDGQRLTQILMNLTSNAIKFTHEGQVTISLMKPDADHWAIKVIDTGIGIPKDAHQYVFDPFRQVDGTIKRKYQGTGLGLSIVKQLVELLHGEITLDSDANQGTTFTVTFPLEIPATAAV